jgi:L-alanine-DL-glutamate epimerase-like enolase superfamily enzyme
VRAESLRVSAFEVPTSSPEADGTLAWSSTVLVTVELSAGAGEGATGLGYTYADVPTAHAVLAHLAKVVFSHDASAVEAIFAEMERKVRNVGRDGIASTAIAAVDGALWDLRAKQRGQPLAETLGARRSEIAAYGSGGFTSYSVDELTHQLSVWKQAGMSRVKMKIGRDPSTLDRIGAARAAIGPDTELFVDANGAYDVKGALALAREMTRYGVVWFEEPVSSDDLDGLRFIRERAPTSMRIAAGEYGYTARYFDRMLSAGAVDVLQADGTRCGVTGFLRAAALCDARGVELSAHCAPTLHAHLGCAAPRMAHVEYFHDHQRIERMLFDGAAVARKGALRPDPARPGLGVALRRSEAEKYLVFDQRVRAGDRR